MQAIHIPTEGMMCEHCTSSVRDVVGHLPGVSGVVPVKSLHLTSVLFDETKVDPAVLVEAIRKAGFEAHL